MKAFIATLVAVSAFPASLAGPAGASAASGRPAGFRLPAAAAAHRGSQSLAARGVPGSFVAAALCVHDGYYHSPRPPFARVADAPGWGEAPWHYRGGHRGGLQWTFGTWYSAGGRGDPADASPAEEIYRAFVHVVRQRQGWGAWPLTARACGLL